MVRLAWIVGGVILSLPILAAPASAEPAGPRSRSVLVDVKALQKPVTYTETKIPLGELVQKVAADTGVKLTAARDVADEPVAVVVKDLPARDLLEQLADLLDYRWARHGTDRAWRYEIWQDLAARQREKALREAALTDAERQFQEAVKRVVEMAALPPEQIQRILEEGERQSRELAKLGPEREAAARDSPEEAERLQRMGAAAFLWSPIGRALANLLGHLTPSHWALLRQGQLLILSTDPKPGELPLPPETVQAFRASPLHFYPPWLSPALPDEKHAESIRQEAKKQQEQWTGAPGYQVAIGLEKLQLTMSATPLRDGAPIRDFWAEVGPISRSWQSLPDRPFSHRPRRTPRGGGRNWSETLSSAPGSRSGPKRNRVRTSGPSGPARPGLSAICSPIWPAPTASRSSRTPMTGIPGRSIPGAFPLRSRRPSPRFWIASWGIAVAGTTAGSWSGCGAGPGSSTGRGRFRGA